MSKDNNVTPELNNKRSRERNAVAGNADEVNTVAGADNIDSKERVTDNFTETVGDESTLDEIEKRREKRKRKLKKPGFFTRVFIVLGILIALIAFSMSGFFTVDTIDVQGNKYYTDEEITNLAHATTGRNLIYKLNKRQMLKYLEKNPYIEEARVYRRLPSTIVINVTERIQIAALTYGDQYLIIDGKGTGFKVKKVELGEQVGVSNTDLFKNLLSLLGSMQSGDVYFTKINVTELFITANVYDSLVVRSKYKDLKDTIDKGRLHKVLDELFKRNIKRGTITISSDGYASFTPEL